jgi:hypothetical protein
MIDLPQSFVFPVFVFLAFVLLPFVLLQAA